MYSHIDGRLDVSNSIVSGNVALNPTSGQGGALCGTAALVDLTYCTLVGNRATVGSSLVCVASGGKGGQVSVNSCILWDEGDTVFVGDNALLQIDYSTVREGWHGSTNSAADPRFVQMGYWDDGATPGDPADDTWFDGDYHLLWDSPCIEGGDPLLIPEAGETDLDGQPRLSGEIVDMGVYEVHNQPPVAVVGPWTTGFTLDGKAGALTLNAGDSYDPEGLPLVYQWYLDGELVSREVTFTTRLPMGSHPFKLIVSDSVGVSASVEGVAEIVKPVDTIATVSPSTITHRGTGSPITVSIVLPLGSRLSDFPPFEKLLLYPGGIEADHQIAFAWLGSKVLVVAKFDRAKFFEVAPTYGEVNVRVIGRLRDGSFFGSSNIVTLR
jgi:hypothetical protein